MNHGLASPLCFAAHKAIRLTELNASRQYDEIGLQALLTQAGYYTIERVTEDGYVFLNYPNREVAVSMAQLYTDMLLAGKRWNKPGATSVVDTLSRGTTHDVVEQFNYAFNTIDDQNYPVDNEAICRAIVQILLTGAGLSPRVEVHTALGRSDLEVDIGARRWVFELKYAQKTHEVQELLTQAIEQVKEKRYGQTPHGLELLRVTMVFSKEQRCFVDYSDV